MTIAFILILLIILVSGIIWQVGARSQKPRKLANDKSQVEGLPYQPLEWFSEGSKVKGWLLGPTALKDSQAQSQVPLVIIAHGWGSNRSRVMRYAAPLIQEGYAVLMYDARSHGDSDSIKAPSAFMFRDDVLAAVGIARKLPGIDPERIALIGHSLGGLGAILALAEGLRVRALVTDSMPVQFSTMVRAELKRQHLPLFPLVYLIPMIWLLRARITREQYRKADIPAILTKYAHRNVKNKQSVLMIHSNEDDFIPAEELHSLERQLPSGLIHTLFVNAKGHSGSEQDPAFWRTLLPYLAERFSDGALHNPLSTSSIDLLHP